MENENKEFQGSVEESELQEKVRQDVAEKVAEAAAEVQDEIDSAAEIAEDAEDVEAAEEAFDEDAELVYDAEALEAAEEELVPVKEPVKVTMNLSKLVLSLVGTAVLGAVLVLGGMQISKLAARMPEGATIATVEGNKLTEPVAKFYLYQAAVEYLNENGGTYQGDMSEFNWTSAGEDGKTAEEVVKENAIKQMEEGAVLLWATKDKELEWDEEGTRDDAEYTLRSTKRSLATEVGAENAEEMMDLMLRASGFATEKGFIQLNLWQTLTQAATTVFQEDVDGYYPEDRSVLEQYLSEDTAAYRAIFVEKETLENEEEQAAADEAARAQAQELLDRINNGEDFEAVMTDGGSGENPVSYLSKSSNPDEMETTVFGLKANEVSGIIEETDGFYIVQRVVGENELLEYMKAQANLKFDEKKMAALSLQQILSNIETAMEDYETKLTEYQTAE